MPALMPEARDLLLAFSTVAIDEDVLEGAMNEPDRALRAGCNPPGYRSHPRPGS
jgi:uncharacterized protein